MVSIPPRTAIYSPMIGCVIVKQVKTSNMKISEVIKKLQEIQEEDGDFDVIVLHDGFEDNIGDMEFYVERHKLYIE